MATKVNTQTRSTSGKKLIALVTCLVFLTGIAYAETGDGNRVEALRVYEPLQLKSALPSMQESQPFHPQSRGVTPVLFEDFETGAPDWYSVDETAIPPAWHTDEYNAYEGKSWWMGDPEVGPNGGYLDHWYQVLDTPPITLPTAEELTLSFYQYRAIEEPGVSGNFDGWDGFNVRIRPVGAEYADAEILTICEPAYNCSSMYSFGFEHGEDPDGIPGIPGWGGSTGSWIYTKITIPPSYQGQDVIISFAFASDPAFCTSDDPSLIGVFVDNISVGDFFNDAEDETGFYSFSNVPVAGDLWHIYEDTSAPSPTHAEGCFDEATGTYNPNMENFLVGPKIEFPSGTNVTWDMYVQTGLDEGVFPDCDFLYVEIRSRFIGEDTWRGWISISNPTYDPDGTNYVFTGTIEEWYPFSQGWPGYSNLTVLDGLADSIQMRVGLHSNADDPTTIGFRVDNFGIYSELDVLPPSNLVGNYINGNVELTWNPPSGLGGEMQWDDGSFENAISFSSGTGYMGEEFPVGGACTIEEFTVFGYQFGGPTTIGVFEKSEGVYPATPTYTMPITTQAGTPATYTVNWDVQDDFILAFMCSSTIDIALDENTVPSEHSYALSGGAWVTWQDLAASAGLPDGEFGVRCTTTYPEVEEPNGYNVYHSLTSGDYTDPITTVTDTFYTHTEPVGGADNFYVVSAVYDEGESAFSNEVAVFAENPDYVEYAYDDGTAETGYHAGYPQSYLAVRITPDEYPVAVRRLKYYITSVTQQVVLQIWDDDGADGLPGTQLLSPPIVLSTANQIADVWNTVTLDSTVYDIEFQDGDFYIGWFEGNNASLIGVDTDGASYNRSYQYTDGEWYDYSDGIPQNFMMRVVVEPVEPGIGPGQETPDFVLTNYPNPVKSTTTFRCNIKGSLNQEVEIEIYNILGQLVDTVKGKNGEDIEWTNENLANGIYFYKVKSDEATQIKKMVILR